MTGASGIVKTWMKSFKGTSVLVEDFEKEKRDDPKHPCETLSRRERSRRIKAGVVSGDDISFMRLKCAAIPGAPVGDR